MDRDSIFNVFRVISTILLVVGLFYVVVYPFIVTLIFPETLINYGNDDYTFVLVSVGSGRSETFYEGTISQTDYQKWVNGEPGTIFIYSTHLENRGNRVNIASITHITNYGTSPKWLPGNFY